MIGIVIVTHGNLAKEFIVALEHVVGPQENIFGVCIFPEDDMDKRRKEILNSIKNADSGKGVIVTTDMFGGTPSNLAISTIVDGKTFYRVRIGPFTNTTSADKALTKLIEKGFPGAC